MYSTNTLFYCGVSIPVVSFCAYPKWEPRSALEEICYFTILLSSSCAKTSFTGVSNGVGHVWSKRIWFESFLRVHVEVIVAIHKEAISDVRLLKH